MKKFLLPLVIAIFIASCSSSRQLVNQQPATNLTDTAIQTEGLSYENAVIINESVYYKGVNDEYKWLKNNYPGYRVLKQDISYYDNKPYDLFTIKVKDGEEKLIYFNIASFFGDL